MPKGSWYAKMILTEGFRLQNADRSLVTIYAVTRVLVAARQQCCAAG
jgi:hypothetical protein